MQIKTTTHTLEQKRQKRTDNTNVLIKRIQSNRNSHTLVIRMQNCIATWKKVWQFLRKLNIYLKSIIPLLGIYPSESKQKPHKKYKTNKQKTLRGKVIVALFVIAQSWKQPRFLSTGKWINKLWYATQQ